MPYFINVTSLTTYFRLIVTRSLFFSIQHSSYSLSNVSAIKSYAILQKQLIIISWLLRQNVCLFSNQYALLELLAIRLINFLYTSKLSILLISVNVLSTKYFRRISIKQLQFYSVCISRYKPRSSLAALITQVQYTIPTSIYEQFFTICKHAILGLILSTVRN